MTCVKEMPDDAVLTEDGGVSVFRVGGHDVHWNAYVPGANESYCHPVTQVRSTRSAKTFRRQAGVYRLIALDEKGDPKQIGRLCDIDQTGTLYIGREGFSFAERGRASQLVRSLFAARTFHGAGQRITGHNRITEMFPRFAIAWFYNKNSRYAESVLFDSYITSFGELPPLNRRRG